jgi:mannose/fructose/N-acetylgalactosamine-specific phosphotransferase system component IIB
MKELIKDFKESEVEIAVEKQQRKEIKLIGRQRKIRGHILWEFNQKTKELIPATYKKQDFNVTSLTPSPSAVSISNKVQVNENCLYFQALNRANAIKKLGKGNLQPA